MNYWVWEILIKQGFVVGNDFSEFLFVGHKLSYRLMNIREHARDWIQNSAKGTVFDVSDICDFILDHFPTQCSRSGLTEDSEEKWKKDSRWSLQDLKFKKVVIHMGRRGSGKWKRT